MQYLYTTLLQNLRSIKTVIIPYFQDPQQALVDDKYELRNYYGSGTGGRCCICAQQTQRVHSPGGSTFLCEMTLWPAS